VERRDILADYHAPPSLGNRPSGSPIRRKDKPKPAPLELSAHPRRKHDGRSLKGHAMTFLEDILHLQGGACDEHAAPDTAIADPARTPEMAGRCGIEGCACPALVEDFSGYCLRCKHTASEHW